MAHLYLSAAHKSSGKTTLTLGLARALRRRGLRVQVFKKGPDYIDPIWHSQASGRPCYNLDFHMMQRAEIDALFARHAAAADLSLIEGNKGLYDGMDLEGSDSNAALARQLRAPVVLVLDAQGITRGIAPLILGYRAFDPEVHIAGVILNKVAGPRHESKLRAAVARYTGVEVLGCIHRDPRMEIVERHLGLMPGNETLEAEARIEAIAERVAAQVDLDALLEIARSAPILSPSAPPLAEGKDDDALREPLRIGIARDRAFGFYYNEDLEALAAEGKLIPVDTLKDARLPEIDALILGGGFPEVFMDELSANATLRADIRRAAEAGLPVYAECGGLMYLSRSIAWKGRRGEMVGVVPADVAVGSRPVGRGYVTLQATGAGAWACAAGTPLPAHEFHYSHLENLPAAPSYAYAVRRGEGIDGRHDGYVYKNVVASYCHFRGAGANGWVRRLADHARRVRTARSPAAPTPDSEPAAKAA